MRKITFQRKVTHFFPYLFIFGLSVFLSLSKTLGWVVSNLEWTKLSRAFNAFRTFIIYFPNIWQWLVDFPKNEISDFSLNYILPAPLLYFFGKEIGFKIFFAIFGGLNASFVYFFINRIFQPKEKKEKFIAFLTALILVFSWGFSVLSGVCLMEPSMVFFLLLAFYFFLQQKYFLFGLSITVGALCKMPILAIMPGFFLYILVFRKDLLKNKNLWFSAILGGLLFFLTYKVIKNSAGQGNILPGIPSFSLLDKFSFSHLKNLFISAPVLTIMGILGLFNLRRKEKEKLLPIIFSVFSLMIFYFSAITVGPHYIYFLFPFLSIFSFFFLKKLNLRSVFIIFLVNLIIFKFSYQEEPVFSEFPKANLPQVRKIVSDNLEENEFILTHGRIWDYFLWNKPFSLIKDIEWYGNVDIQKSAIPKDYIDHAGVILLYKSQINNLLGWQYLDQFKFKDEIDGWYIFVRRR